MKRKIFISIITLFVITGLSYSADDTGTTSASFLKIGTSSRYLGRGEAFSAMVDDPTALTANVAGLGNINNMEILFSHYEWAIDIDYEHLAFVKPVFKGLYDFQGVMGFGITYLHLPSFNHYDDWGEDIGDLNANSLAFITGYGQRLYMFDVGIGLKVVKETADDVTDYAFGTDIGLIYTYKMPRRFLFLNTFGKSIKFAMTVQNITLDDGIKGYKLPTLFRFGIGSEVFNDFEFEVDFEKPLDSRLRLNTGLEYNIRNYVNIRAGYRFLGYDVDSFTLGLGVRYPFGTKLVKVDAGYAPEGALKNTASLTFGVKFPGVSSEKDWKMANILYYKGIYYYTNGDLDKAIGLWKEVLKLNPDHVKAKEKIKDAQYLKKLKEVEDKVKHKYPGDGANGTQ